MDDSFIEEEEEISEEERLLRLTCFRVMDKCCKNCLFGNKKLVSDQRRDDILTVLDPDRRVSDAAEEKTFFVCHLASVRHEVVCCRAFFEHYKDRLPRLRFVQMLAESHPEVLRFVHIDEEF